mmetsp:Transcript_8707/g.35260  ORF Transcript_8707/g.35260 Transcript_8707/m.35260 type:complete len:251 (-) Transcript_8707:139-891(-)
MDTSVEDGSTSAGSAVSASALATRMLPFSSHMSSTSPLLCGLRLADGGLSERRGAPAVSPPPAVPPAEFPTEASDRSLLDDADLPSVSGSAVGFDTTGVDAVASRASSAGGTAVVVSLAAGTSTPISFATPSAARSRSCWVLDARLRGSAYAPAACLNLARFSADARTSWESATRASALATALAQASFPSGSGSSRIESAGIAPSASAASRGRFKNGNVSLATGSEPDELRLEGPGDVHQTTIRTIDVPT